MKIDTSAKAVLGYAASASLTQTDYKVLLSLIVWSKQMRVNIGPTEAGKRLSLSPQAVSRSYRNLKKASIVHEHDMGGYTIGAPMEFVPGQMSLGL